MTTSKFTKGALVYLPAGAKLYQVTEGDAVVRYKITPRPAHVLFVEKLNDGDCRVLYEGESWQVPFNDVYPLRGNNREY